MGIEPTLSHATRIESIHMPPESGIEPTLSCESVGSIPTQVLRFFFQGKKESRDLHTSAIVMEMSSRNRPRKSTVVPLHPFGCETNKMGPTCSLYTCRFNQITH